MNKVFKLISPKAIVTYSVIVIALIISVFILLAAHPASHRVATNQVQTLANVEITNGLATSIKSNAAESVSAIKESINQPAQATSIAEKSADNTKLVQNTTPKTLNDLTASEIETKSMTQTCIDTAPHTQPVNKTGEDWRQFLIDMIENHNYAYMYLNPQGELACIYPNTESEVLN